MDLHHGLLGAKRRGRKTTHQTQAARRQDGGKPAGHLHARPDTPLISGWGFPQTPREQAAEAPEAREPDLHADVGHGMFAHRKQISGAIEPGLDSELVRRQTEDCLELADKVKRRDVDLAREVHD